MKFKQANNSYSYKANDESESCNIAKFKHLEMLFLLIIQLICKVRTRY